MMLKLRAEVINLKKIVMLSFFILLTGCFLNTPQPDFYVFVVEGKDNLIKTFDEHATVKNPYIKIDYFKNAKTAKKQFTDYEFDELPIVFIFSVNKNKEKKLLLRTNKIEESISYLKSLKNEK